MSAATVAVGSQGEGRRIVGGPLSALVVVATTSNRRIEYSYAGEHPDVTSATEAPRRETPGSGSRNDFRRRRARVSVAMTQDDSWDGHRFERARARRFAQPRDSSGNNALDATDRGCGLRVRRQPCWCGNNRQRGAARLLRSARARGGCLFARHQWGADRERVAAGALLDLFACTVVMCTQNSNANKTFLVDINVVETASWPGQHQQLFAIAWPSSSRVLDAGPKERDLSLCQMADPVELWRLCHDYFQS